MFLKRIILNNDIEYDVIRQSHLDNFKVKTKKYIYEYRTGGTYNENRRYIPKTEERVSNTFKLFKKNFELNFDNNLFIIVGDNGTGKSTIMNMLKVGDFFERSLSDKWDDIRSKMSDEELFKFKWEKFIKKDGRTLEFEKIPLYIISGNGIHKNMMIDNYLKNLPNGEFQKAEQILSLWDMQSYSNGENTIDYISNLQHFENSLIILDEPETSLSIKSVRKICEILKKISEKNQLIIITHNEHIMNLSEYVFSFDTKRKVKTKTYIKTQYK